VNVTIPCPCPPKADGTARHESDTVTLPEVLDFRTTIVVRQSIQWLKTNDPDATVPEIVATLAETYLLHCIEEWSLVDDKGKAVPVSKAAIRERLLPATEAAMAVGNAADDLYTDKVVLPLFLQASSSSPPTQTDEPTSPTSGPGPTPRKPSKRSSITTTPMAVTGPMAASPGGASSSSLS
jgi:hypothetical protein